MESKAPIAKQPIVDSIRQRIESLGELAREIEESEIPDLAELGELPRIIRQRREALGLSCNEAAELTGVSATTWRALENDSGNPRLNTLLEAARTLNLKLWVERA